LTFPNFLSTKKAGEISLPTDITGFTEKAYLGLKILRALCPWGFDSPSGTMKNKDGHFCMAKCDKK
jgi:hypothetical protein